MTVSTHRCPSCAGDYTYYDGAFQVCPDCGHEWDPNDSQVKNDIDVIKDSNGNVLTNGCDIILIKDLKLKGSSAVLKKGTKVKSIRLVDGDHEIDCKIEGMNVMLKACFVKRA